MALVSAETQTKVVSKQNNNRILIIASSASYRTTPFVEAALSLGTEVVIASEGKYALAAPRAEALHIPLDDVDTARKRILAEAARSPFSGVIGTDDATSELAAMVAGELRLAHNPPAAVRLSRRKDLARQCLLDAGLPTPVFCRVDLKRSLTAQLQDISYPCVAKPVSLSASRGVIRADNREQLIAACGRIAAILDSENAADGDRSILVEQFIPGVELAVDAMLCRGSLTVLATFDKPELLDGPFFEESYYVSPSRLDGDQLQAVYQSISNACNAYGLSEGPIHAECRVNESGIWILEVAARTIGGMCSRLFRFGGGHSLEQLVLAWATGQPVNTLPSDAGAGVLMIPVPQAGILRRVEGLMAAQRVPYIEEVSIEIRQGYELVPLPEGSSYLGFIFARAPDAAAAEQALRSAHACLNIVVAPLWKGAIN